jgi:hypothetical protein
MNPDLPNEDESLQRRKKIEIRQQGIFFILGGLIFLVQGLFNLSDNLAWFLVVGLAVVYAFVLKRQPVELPASRKKRTWKFLGQFALLVVAALAILFAWVWIWNLTGIRFSYLAAGTCGVLGLGLIVWSYIKVSAKAI